MDYPLFPPPPQWSTPPTGRGCILPPPPLRLAPPQHHSMSPSSTSPHGAADRGMSPRRASPGGTPPHMSWHHTGLLSPCLLLTPVLPSTDQGTLATHLMMRGKSTVAMAEQATGLGSACMEAPLGTHDHPHGGSL